MARNKTKTKDSEGTDATVFSAYGDAVGDHLRAMRAQVRASEAARKLELTDDEADLALRGAPLWTLRTHRRIRSIGGAVLFAAMMLVLWPAALTAVYALVRLVGVNLVTELPGTVLSDLGISVQALTASTDRFVFSWLMPVVFFVVVLAMLTAWAVKALASAGLRWSRAVALGLFAGHRAKRSTTTSAETAQTRS